MPEDEERDTLDLACGLCTRAGMLLEDASGMVIPIGHLGREELLALVRDARSMAQDAGRILAAAEALLSVRHDASGDDGAS